MSRENTVHDFNDHDLRWIVRASKFSYKGSILGVFSHGEFYSKSSVTAVKLDGEKDWNIIPIGKNIMHDFYERATVEFCFYYIVKTGIRLVGHVVGKSSRGVVSYGG
jgi:hypothetical protein